MDRAEAALRLSISKVLPYLAFLLALMPSGELRLAGWLTVAVYSLYDYRWPFRLLILSVPFTAVGSYRLFFTLKPFQILFVIIMFSLAWHWLKGNLPRRRRTKLDVVLVLLVVSMLLSMVNTVSAAQSARLFLNYLILILLTQAVLGWYPSAEINRIPALLFAGAALMAPIQVVNLYLHEFNSKYIPNSTFEGGYTTADYLVFVLPMVVLFPAPGRVMRWVKVLVIALLLTDLKLTYSRGAWYAGAAALLFLALVRPRLLQRGWKTIAVAALLTAALFVNLMIASDYFANEYYSYFYRRATPGFIIAGSVFQTHYQDIQVATEHWRLAVWRKAWDGFVVPHWLLGSGVGIIGLPYFNPPTHNNLLQIAGELGALGLVIFILLYARSAVALWRQRRTLPALASAASMIGLFIHGLVFNTLILWHHWFLLAYAILLTVGPEPARDVVPDGAEHG